MKHDKRPVIEDKSTPAPPMFERGFHCIGVGPIPYGKGLAVVTVEVDASGRATVVNIGRPQNAIGSKSYITGEAKLALFHAVK